MRPIFTSRCFDNADASDLMHDWMSSNGLCACKGERHFPTFFLDHDGPNRSTPSQASPDV
jgi:hypothetical protein